MSSNCQSSKGHICRISKMTTNTISIGKKENISYPGEKVVFLKKQRSIPFLQYPINKFKCFFKFLENQCCYELQ